MSNFKRGDVIVNNSKLYRCIISGEYEAAFKAFHYPGLFGYKGPSIGWGSSLGVKNSVSSNDIIILNVDKCFYLDKKNRTTEYPILGVYPVERCATFNIILPRLKKYYPKQYTKFLKFLKKKNK